MSFQLILNIAFYPVVPKKQERNKEAQFFSKSYNCKLLLE